MYVTGYGDAPRPDVALPGGGSDGDVLTIQPDLSVNWEAPIGGGSSGDTITYLPDVVAYTGGGSTKLDGVTTVGVSVPAMYQFVSTTSPTGARFYKLRAGTDAESSPGLIRPDDYNGATNAKVWESVLALIIIGMIHLVNGLI